MADEEKTESKKKTGGILEVITSKIKELTTLGNAVVALLTVAGAILALVYGLRDPGTSDPTSTRAQECLTAELSYPQDAAVTQWLEGQFSLTGQNKCGRPVTVHVAFKSLEANIRILPLHCQIVKLDKPGCWAEQTLDPGEVDWSFKPTFELKITNDPNGVLASVQMKSVIYADPGTKVRAVTSEFLLRDDRPAAEEAALYTAP